MAPRATVCGNCQSRAGARMRIRFILLAALLALLAASPAQAQTGYDRRGGDYTTFQIRNGDPAVCASRCERDARCRAWSFSYPRTENALATCWLKNRVTPRVEDKCCVSGVRGAGVIEPRRGGRIFDRPLRRRLSQFRDRARSRGRCLQRRLRRRQALPRLDLCAARLRRARRALLFEGQDHPAAPQAVLYFGSGEINRHGRACPGHPALPDRFVARAWMPGPRPRMTRSLHRAEEPRQP